MVAAYLLKFEFLAILSRVLTSFCPFTLFVVVKKIDISFTCVCQYEFRHNIVKVVGGFDTVMTKNGVNFLNVKQYLYFFPILFTDFRPTGFHIFHSPDCPLG